MTTVILRIRGVKVATGLSTASVYRLMNEGLLPRPVHIGIKSVGWPEYEIEAINNARIAGADNVEIRELVSLLVAARSERRGKSV